MHTVIIGKRKYECPSSWDELSGDQLVKVAEIIHMRISTREALARVLVVLLNVRRSIRLSFLFVFRVSVEQKYTLLQAVEWVLASPMQCTDQKLPTIRTRGRIGHKLYGPLKDCRRFVFMEFIEADTAYLSFWKAQNEVEKMEHLNKLVAILYRDRNPQMHRTHPRPLQRRGVINWNGDPRCGFNANVLDYKVNELKRLPVKYKFAILMFYDACHKKWERNYPNIFKKAKDKGDNEGGGWANALMHLAGGSINVDRMMEVNAAAALYDLNARIVENEQMKSEMGKG